MTTDTTTAQTEAEAAQQAEDGAFLDNLEKEAEQNMREWMSARVPERMRKMFDERFPPPAPPSA